MHLHWLNAKKKVSSLSILPFLSMCIGLHLHQCIQQLRLYQSYKYNNVIAKVKFVIVCADQDKFGLSRQFDSLSGFLFQQSLQILTFIKSISQ
jgi:hypothetical protein